MSALDTPFLASDFFGESNIDAEETSLAFPIAPRYTQLTPDGDLNFPSMLPLELALNPKQVDEIRQMYDLSESEFSYLLTTPAFVSAYKEAQELVKEEGMSFRIKAKMQAEEMLKTSWKMVHDNDVPPSVRADLIKATVRWANLEPAKEQQNPFAQGGGLNIQINLG